MIYLASFSVKALMAYNAIHPNEKLNVLVSFGRLEKDIAGFLFSHRSKLNSIVLDSGVWTLNLNPEMYRDQINLRAYQSYLQAVGKYFDFYFNFDEVMSEEGFDQNYSNQLQLEAAGLKPVPVVHDSYGPEVQLYIDLGYSLVSLGSSEVRDADVNELYRIVDRFYSQGIKVHLLGSTNYEKLANLPVYSCDSSTWNHAGSRGHILYWNPNKPGDDKTDLVCFDEKRAKRLSRNPIETYPFRIDLESYLEREFGYSIDDLAGSQGWFKRQLVNIHFYVQLEKRIAAEHREFGYRF
jgi:hypothetical protein